MSRAGRIARRVVKVVAWTLVAIVSVVVLALATVFIGVRTDPGASLLLRVALGVAEGTLAAKITVGRLHTNLWSGIELDDVEMRDIGGELAARVAVLKVRFSLVPLTHQTLHVTSVDIEGGMARVRSLPDGRVNFAALLKPSTPTPPRPDAPASKFRVEIEDVHADIEGRYEAPRNVIPPIQGHVQVTGRVAIGGGDVKVGVAGLNVKVDKPGPLTLAAHGGLIVREGNVIFDDTQVSIDTEGKTLHPFVASPELRGKYHIDVDGKGPLAALDLKVEVYTPSKPLKVDGQLKIGDVFGWTGHVTTRDLDPELIVVGTPHARLWLDAKGESVSDGVTFAVAHAQVEAAKNRVHVSGKLHLGKTITADGEAEIAATDLSQLKGRGLPKLAGNVSGLAKVHYSPAGIVIDSDLTAQNLEVPGLKLRQVGIRAHTKNLSGSVILKARDLYAGSMQLTDTHFQFNGDKKSFLLRLGATGNGGTSIDLALAGTPRYEAGPMPVGVSTEVNALDVDRNGERWRVDSGAVLAYDHGIRIERFRARSARQSLAIDGHLDLEKRTVDANVHAVGLDLNRIVALITKADGVPHSKLDLSVQARGPLAHPIADVALAGTLIENAKKPEEQIHAHVDAHLLAKSVSAKVDLETDAGSLSVDAALPFVTSLSALLASASPLSLKVDAKVKSLAEVYETAGWKPPPALHPLEAKLALSLALTGTGKAPKLVLSLDGDGIRYGSLEDAELRAKVAFAQSQLKTDVTFSLGTVTSEDDEGQSVSSKAGQLVLSATLPIVIARILGAGTLDQKLGVQSVLAAQVKLKAIALGVLPLGVLGIPPLVDAGLLDGQIDLGGTVQAPTVRVLMGAKGIKRGTIDDIGLNLGLESKAHATEASIVVGVKQSTLLVVKARAGTDLGVLMAGADLKRTPIDASVDLPSFDLSKLAALVPGLAGKLKGQVLAKGTVATPSMKATLSIDSLAFGQTRFDAFAIDGAYAGGHMNADLNAHEPSGGLMKASFALAGGNLKLALAIEKLLLDFESEGDSVPIRRLHGQLDAHLIASGSMPNPVVNGDLHFTKTALGLVADPREISGVELHATIHPGELKLDTLKGKLGPGSFDITGDAKLTGLLPTTTDIHIKTTKLQAVQNPISVAVDSKIDVHAELKGRSLVGTVNIQKGSDAKLPTLTNVRSLQDTGDLKDVVYNDTKSRKKAAKKAKQVAAVEAGTALDVDIETHLPGPFHVQSDELQVDFKGDLTMRVHGPTFSLKGEVQALTGGRLEILGNRYVVDKIRVGFDGSPVIDPQLDVKVSRQLSQATISVEVTGSASKPDVRLASDPPIYSESQVILAILGSDPGQPTADTSLSDKVGGAVSGLIVGQIKNVIAPHLPIDVIKVDVGDTDSNISTRLEVGKYIKNNVYVSYVHQFGQLLVGTQQLSANLGNVEYRFKRNYAVEFTIGDAPEGRADLVWTLRY